MALLGRGHGTDPCPGEMPALWAPGDLEAEGEASMTLSEAARTGRRFRRRAYPDDWYFLEGRVMRRRQASGGQVTIEIDAEMIVSTDWEPEPLRLELTAEDISRAARQLDDLVSKRRLSASEFAKHLSIELGLLEPTP
jgi:hypothetical protein